MRPALETYKIGPPFCLCLTQGFKTSFSQILLEDLEIYNVATPRIKRIEQVVPYPIDTGAGGVLPWIRWCRQPFETAIFAPLGSCFYDGHNLFKRESRSCEGSAHWCFCAKQIQGLEKYTYFFFQQPWRNSTLPAPWKPAEKDDQTHRPKPSTTKVSIADPRAADCPLVAVSDQFEVLTGYAREDACSGSFGLCQVLLGI